MQFPHLNDEQRHAVEAPIDRPLKIAAGAGAGKTLVLTERYLHLLSKGFSVESILTLTFTRKAAAELRTKVYSVLPNPRDILHTQIHNFDAFFLSILTSNALYADLAEPLKILEGVEANLFRKTVIDNVIQKMNNLPPLAPNKIRRFIEKIMNAVDSVRLNLVNFQSFQSEIIPHTIPPEFALLIEEIFRELENGFARLNALDFPEINLRCYKMLSANESIRKTLNRKFRYILIDEVQDTNPAQFKLLSLIADFDMRNVTVVGDDKQSIYGFRGADIENIRQFKGKVYPLSMNFRSPQPILDMGHQLICQDEYFQVRSDEIRIKPHKPTEGITIQFHTTPDLAGEAEFVSGEIAHLANSGIKFRDIAVLCRTKAPLIAFEKALHQAGIPCQTIGGGYFDREEIKDIWAILKHFIDVKNPAPAARMKLRNIGHFTCNAGTRLRLSALPLPEAVVELVKSHDYLRRRSVLDDKPLRIAANLDKLYEMAAEFIEYDPERTIEDFADYLEECIQSYPDELEAEISGADAVNLLTIHRAKGLEWDIVFYVEFSPRNRKPNEPDFIFDPQAKELILKEHPLSKEKCQQFALKLQEMQVLEKNIAEEYRLQYVAATRARNQLYLIAQEKSGFPPAIENPGSYLPEDTFDFIENPPDNVPLQFQTAHEIDEDILNSWKAKIANLRPMPPISPPEFINLNFTALYRYLRCPKLYWFRHVVGLPQTITEAPQAVDSLISGAQIGDIFHRLAALDPQFKTDWRNLLPQVVERNILPQLPDEFYDKMEFLIHNYLELDLDKFNDIRTEEPFDFILEHGRGKVRFSGIIDRIDQVEGESRIIDYKTGEAESKERLEEYRLQLTCYAESAKLGAIYIEPEPALYIAALKECKLLEIEFQPDAVDIISQTAEKIAGGEFRQVDDNYCKQCGYRSFCASS